MSDQGRAVGTAIAAIALAVTVLSGLMGLAYNQGSQSHRLDAVEQQQKAFGQMPDRLTRLEILTEETNRNVSDLKQSVRELQGGARRPN